MPRQDPSIRIRIQADNETSAEFQKAAADLKKLAREGEAAHDAMAKTPALMGKFGQAVNRLGDSSRNVAVATQMVDNSMKRANAQSAAFRDLQSDINNVQKLRIQDTRQLARAQTDIIQGEKTQISLQRQITRARDEDRRATDSQARAQDNYVKNYANRQQKISRMMDQVHRRDSSRRTVQTTRIRRNTSASPELRQQQAQYNQLKQESKMSAKVLRDIDNARKEFDTSRQSSSAIESEVKKMQRQRFQAGGRINMARAEVSKIRVMQDMPMRDLMAQLPQIQRGIQMAQNQAFQAQSEMIDVQNAYNEYTRKANEVISGIRVPKPAVAKRQQRASNAGTKIKNSIRNMLKDEGGFVNFTKTKKANFGGTTHRFTRSQSNVPDKGTAIHVIAGNTQGHRRKEFYKQVQSSGKLKSLTRAESQRVKPGIIDDTQHVFASPYRSHYQRRDSYGVGLDWERMIRDNVAGARQYRPTASGPPLKDQFQVKTGADAIKMVRDAENKSRMRIKNETQTEIVIPDMVDLNKYITSILEDGKMYKKQIEESSQQTVMSYRDMIRQTAINIKTSIGKFIKDEGGYVNVSKKKKPQYDERDAKQKMKSIDVNVISHFGEKYVQSTELHSKLDIDNHTDDSAYVKLENAIKIFEKQDELRAHYNQQRQAEDDERERRRQEQERVAKQNRERQQQTFTNFASAAERMKTLKPAPIDFHDKPVAKHTVALDTRDAALQRKIFDKVIRDNHILANKYVENTATQYSAMYDIDKIAGDDRNVFLQNLAGSSGRELLSSSGVEFSFIFDAKKQIDRGGELGDDLFSKYNDEFENILSKHLAKSGLSMPSREISVPDVQAVIERHRTQKRKTHTVVGQFTKQQFQDFYSELESSLNQIRHEERVVGNLAHESLGDFSEIVFPDKKSLLEDDFMGVIKDNIAYLTPETYDQYSDEIQKEISALKKRKSLLEENINSLVRTSMLDEKLGKSNDANDVIKDTVKRKNKIADLIKLFTKDTMGVVPKGTQLSMSTEPWKELGKAYKKRAVGIKNAVTDAAKSAGKTLMSIGKDNSVQIDVAQLRKNIESLVPVPIDMAYETQLPLAHHSVTGSKPAESFDSIVKSGAILSKSLMTKATEGFTGVGELDMIAGDDSRVFASNLKAVSPLYATDEKERYFAVLYDLEKSIDKGASLGEDLIGHYFKILSDAKDRHMPGMNEVNTQVMLDRMKGDPFSTISAVGKMPDTDFKRFIDDVMKKIQNVQENNRHYNEEAKKIADYASEVTFKDAATLDDDRFAGLVAEGMTFLKPEFIERFRDEIDKNIKDQQSAAQSFNAVMTSREPLDIADGAEAFMKKNKSVFKRIKNSLMSLVNENMGVVPKGSQLAMSAEPWKQLGNAYKKRAVAIKNAFTDVMKDEGGFVDFSPDVSMDRLKKQQDTANNIAFEMRMDLIKTGTAIDTGYFTSQGGDASVSDADIMSDVLSKMENQKADFIKAHVEKHKANMAVLKKEISLEKEDSPEMKRLLASMGLEEQPSMARRNLAEAEQKDPVADAEKEFNDNIRSAKIYVRDGLERARHQLKRFQELPGKIGETMDFNIGGGLKTFIRDIEREKSDVYADFDPRFWDDAEHIVNAYGDQGMSSQRAFESILSSLTMKTRGEKHAFSSSEGMGKIFFAQGGGVRGLKGIQPGSQGQNQYGVILDAQKLIRDAGAVVRNRFKGGGGQDVSGEDAIDILKNYMKDNAQDKVRGVDALIEIIHEGNLNIQDYVKGVISQSAVYVNPIHLQDEAQKEVAESKGLIKRAGEKMKSVFHDNVGVVPKGAQLAMSSEPWKELAEGYKKRAVGIKNAVTGAMKTAGETLESITMPFGEGNIQLFRDLEREKAGTGQYDLRYLSDAEHITTDRETLEEIMRSRKLKRGVPMDKDDPGMQVQPDRTILPEGHVFLSQSSLYRDKDFGGEFEKHGVILDAQKLITDLEARVRVGMPGDPEFDRGNIDAVPVAEGQDALNAINNVLRDNIDAIKKKKDGFLEIAVPDDVDLKDYFKGLFIDDKVFMTQDHLTDNIKDLDGAKKTLGSKVKSAANKIRKISSDLVKDESGYITAGSRPDEEKTQDDFQKNISDTKKQLDAIRVNIAGKTSTMVRHKAMEDLSLPRRSFHALEHMVSKATVVEKEPTLDKAEFMMKPQSLVDGVAELTQKMAKQLSERMDTEPRTLASGDPNMAHYGLRDAITAIRVFDQDYKGDDWHQAKKSFKAIPDEYKKVFADKSRIEDYVGKEVDLSEGDILRKIFEEGVIKIGQGFQNAYASYARYYRDNELAHNFGVLLNPDTIKNIPGVDLFSHYDAETARLKQAQQQGGVGDAFELLKRQDSDSPNAPIEVMIPQDIDLNEHIMGFVKGMEVYVKPEFADEDVQKEFKKNQGIIEKTIGNIKKGWKTYADGVKERADAVEKGETVLMGAGVGAEHIYNALRQAKKATEGLKRTFNIGGKDMPFVRDKSMEDLSGGVRKGMLMLEHMVSPRQLWDEPKQRFGDRTQEQVNRFISIAQRIGKEMQGKSTRMGSQSYDRIISDLIQKVQDPLLTNFRTFNDMIGVLDNRDTDELRTVFKPEDYKRRTRIIEEPEVLKQMLASGQIQAGADLGSGIGHTSVYTSLGHYYRHNKNMHNYGVMLDPESMYREYGEEMHISPRSEDDKHKMLQMQFMDEGDPINKLDMLRGFEKDSGIIEVSFDSPVDLQKHIAAVVEDQKVYVKETTDLLNRAGKFLKKSIKDIVKWEAYIKGVKESAEAVEKGERVLMGAGISPEHIVNAFKGAKRIQENVMGNLQKFIRDSRREDISKPKTAFHDMEHMVKERTEYAKTEDEWRNKPGEMIDSILDYAKKVKDENRGTPQDYDAIMQFARDFHYKRREKASDSLSKIRNDFRADLNEISKMDDWNRRRTFSEEEVYNELLKEGIKGNKAGFKEIYASYGRYYRENKRAHNFGVLLDPDTISNIPGTTFQTDDMKLHQKLQKYVQKMGGSDALKKFGKKHPNVVVEIVIPQDVDLRDHLKGVVKDNEVFVKDNVLGDSGNHVDTSKSLLQNAADRINQGWKNYTDDVRKRAKEVEKGEKVLMGAGISPEHIVNAFKGVKRAAGRVKDIFGEKHAEQVRKKMESFVPADDFVESPDRMLAKHMVSLFNPLKAQQKFQQVYESGAILPNKLVPKMDNQGMMLAIDQLARDDDRVFMSNSVNVDMFDEYSHGFIVDLNKAIEKGAAVGQDLIQTYNDVQKDLAKTHFEGFVDRPDEVSAQNILDRLKGKPVKKLSRVPDDVFQSYIKDFNEQIDMIKQAFRYTGEEAHAMKDIMAEVTFPGKIDILDDMVVGMVKEGKLKLEESFYQSLMQSANKSEADIRSADEEVFKMLGSMSKTDEPDTKSLLIRTADKVKDGWKNYADGVKKRAKAVEDGEKILMGAGIGAEHMYNTYRKAKGIGSRIKQAVTGQRGPTDFSSDLAGQPQSADDALRGSPRVQQSIIDREQSIRNRKQARQNRYDFLKTEIDKNSEKILNVNELIRQKQVDRDDFISGRIDPSMSDDEIIAGIRTSLESSLSKSMQLFKNTWDMIYESRELKGEYASDADKRSNIQSRQESLNREVEYQVQELIPKQLDDARQRFERISQLPYEYDDILLKREALEKQIMGATNQIQQMTNQVYQISDRIPSDEFISGRTDPSISDEDIISDIRHRSQGFLDELKQASAQRLDLKNQLHQLKGDDVSGYKKGDSVEIATRQLDGWMEDRIRHFRQGLEEARYRHNRIATLPRQIGQTMQIRIGDHLQTFIRDIERDSSDYGEVRERFDARFWDDAEHVVNAYGSIGINSTRKDAFNKIMKQGMKTPSRRTDNALFFGQHDTVRGLFSEAGGANNMYSVILDAVRLIREHGGKVRNLMEGGKQSYGEEAVDILRNYLKQTDDKVVGIDYIPEIIVEKNLSPDEINDLIRGVTVEDKTYVKPDFLVDDAQRDVAESKGLLQQTADNLKAAWNNYTDGVKERADAVESGEIQLMGAGIGAEHIYNAYRKTKGIAGKIKQSFKNLMKDESGFIDIGVDTGIDDDVMRDRVMDMLTIGDAEILQVLESELNRLMGRYKKTGQSGKHAIATRIQNIQQIKSNLIKGYVDFQQELIDSTERNRQQSEKMESDAERAAYSKRTGEDVNPGIPRRGPGSGGRIDVERNAGTALVELVRGDLVDAGNAGTALVELIRGDLVRLDPADLRTMQPKMLDTPRPLEDGTPDPEGKDVWDLGALMHSLREAARVDDERDSRDRDAIRIVRKTGAGILPNILPRTGKTQKPKHFQYKNIDGRVEKILLDDFDKIEDVRNASSQTVIELQNDFIRATDRIKRKLKDDPDADVSVEETSLKELAQSLRKAQQSHNTLLDQTSHFFDLTDTQQELAQHLQATLDTADATIALEDSIKETTKRKTALNKELERIAQEREPIAKELENAQQRVAESAADLSNHQTGFNDSIKELRKSVSTAGKHQTAMQREFDKATKAENKTIKELNDTRKSVTLYNQDAKRIQNNITQMDEAKQEQEKESKRIMSEARSLSNSLRGKISTRKFNIKEIEDVQLPQIIQSIDDATAAYKDTAERVEPELNALLEGQSRLEDVVRNLQSEREQSTTLALNQAEEAIKTLQSDQDSIKARRRELDQQLTDIEAGKVAYGRDTLAPAQAAIDEISNRISRISGKIGSTRKGAVAAVTQSRALDKAAQTKVETAQRTAKSKTEAEAEALDKLNKKQTHHNELLERQLELQSSTATLQGKIRQRTKRQEAAQLSITQKEEALSEIRKNLTQNTKDLENVERSLTSGRERQNELSTQLFDNMVATSRNEAQTELLRQQFPGLVLERDQRQSAADDQLAALEKGRSRLAHYKKLESELDPRHLQPSAKKTFTELKRTAKEELDKEETSLNAIITALRGDKEIGIKGVENELKELAPELKGTADHIESLEQALDPMRRRLREMVQRSAEIRPIIEKAEEHISELDEQKGIRRDADQFIRTINMQLKDTEIKKSPLRKHKAKLEKQLEDAKTDHEKSQKVTAELQAALDEKQTKEMNQLQGRLKRASKTETIDKIKKEIKNLNARIKTSKGGVEKALEQEGIAAGKVLTLQESLAEQNRLIEEAEAELRTQLEEQRERRKEAIGRIKELENQEDPDDIFVAQLRQELDYLETAIGDRSEKPLDTEEARQERLSEFTEEIKKLAERHLDENKKIDEAVKSLEEINTAIQRTGFEIGKAESELPEAVGKLVSAERSMQDIQESEAQLKKKIKDLEARGTRKQIGGMKSANTIAQQKIEELEELGDWVGYNEDILNEFFDAKTDVDPLDFHDVIRDAIASAGIDPSIAADIDFDDDILRDSFLDLQDINTKDLEEKIKLYLGDFTEVSEDDLKDFKLDHRALQTQFDRLFDNVDTKYVKDEIIDMLKEVGIDENLLDFRDLAKSLDVDEYHNVITRKQQELQKEINKRLAKIGEIEGTHGEIESAEKELDDLLKSKKDLDNKMVSLQEQIAEDPEAVAATQAIIDEVRGEQERLVNERKAVERNIEILKETRDTTDKHRRYLQSVVASLTGELPEGMSEEDAAKHLPFLDLEGGRQFTGISSMVMDIASKKQSHRESLDEMTQRRDALVAQRQELEALLPQQEEDTEAARQAYKDRTDDLDRLQLTLDRKKDIDHFRKRQEASVKSMESEYKSLKAEADAAASAVESNLSQLYALHKESIEQHHERNELMREQQRLEQSLIDMAEQKTSLEAEASKLTRDERSTENAIEKSKKELESISEQIRINQTNLKTGQTELTSVTSKLNTSTAQLTALEEKHTKSVKNKTDAINALNEAESKKVQTAKTLESAQAKLTPLEKEYAELINERAEAEENLANLKKRGDADQERIEDINLEKKNLSNRIASLEAELKSARSRRDTAKEADKLSGQRVEEAQVLVDDNLSDQEDLRNELAEAEEAVTAQQEARDKVLQKLKDTQADVNRLQGQYEDSLVDLAEKERAHAAVAEEVKAIQSEITSQQKEMEKAQKNAVDAATKEAEIREELITLVENRQAAEARLSAAMEASKSATDAQDQAESQLAQTKQEHANLLQIQQDLQDGVNLSDEQAATIRKELVEIDKQLVDEERNLAKARKEQDKASQDMQKTAKDMQKNHDYDEVVVDAIERAEHAIQTLNYAFMHMGRSVIEAAGEMEDLNYALIATEGSAFAAKKRMEEMVAVSKKPGIELPSAVRAAVVLKALGVESKQATHTIEEFANTIALIGGGTRHLDRAFLGLQQIVSKGRVLAEEINQMREVTGLFSVALERVYGTQDAEAIAEFVGLGRQHVITNFLTPLVAELSKLKRAGLEGFRNNISNLNTAVFRLKASIGEALLPTINSLIRLLIKGAEAVIGMNESLNGLVSNMFVGASGLLLTVNVLSKMGLASKEVMPSINRMGKAWIENAANIRTTAGIAEGFGNISALSFDKAGRAARKSKLIGWLGKVAAGMTLTKLSLWALGGIGIATILTGIGSYFINIQKKTMDALKATIEYNKEIANTKSYNTLVQTSKHRISALNDEMIKLTEIKKEYEDLGPIQIRGGFGAGSIRAQAAFSYIDSFYRLLDKRKEESDRIYEHPLERIAKDYGGTHFQAIMEQFTKFGRAADTTFLGDIDSRIQKQYDLLEQAKDNLARARDPEFDVKTQAQMDATLNKLQKIRSEIQRLEKENQDLLKGPTAHTAYAESTIRRNKRSIQEMHTSLSPLIDDYRKAEGLLNSYIQEKEKFNVETKNIPLLIEKESHALAMLDHAYEKTKKSVSALLSVEKERFAHLEQMSALEIEAVSGKLTSVNKALEASKSDHEKRLEDIRIQPEIDISPGAKPIAEQIEEINAARRARNAEREKRFASGEDIETISAKEVLLPDDYRVTAFTKAKQEEQEILDQMTKEATLRQEAQTLKDQYDLAETESTNKKSLEKLKTEQQTSRDINKIQTDFVQDYFKIMNARLQREITLEKAHAKAMVDTHRNKFSEMERVNDRLQQMVSDDVQFRLDTPFGADVDDIAADLERQFGMLRKYHDKMKEEMKNLWDIENKSDFAIQARIAMKEFEVGMNAFVGEFAAETGNVDPILLGVHGRWDDAAKVEWINLFGHQTQEMIKSLAEAETDDDFLAIVNNFMDEWKVLIERTGGEAKTYSTILGLLANYQATLIENEVDAQKLKNDLLDKDSDFRKFFNELMKSIIQARETEKEAQKEWNNILKENKKYTMGREFSDASDKLGKFLGGDTLGLTSEQIAEEIRRIEAQLRGIAERQRTDAQQKFQDRMQEITDDKTLFGIQGDAAREQAASELQQEIDAINDTLDDALEGLSRKTESTLKDFDQKQSDFLTKYQGMLSSNYIKYFQDTRKTMDYLAGQESQGVPIEKDPRFKDLENSAKVISSLEAKFNEIDSMQIAMLENQKSNISKRRGLWRDFAGELVGGISTEEAQRMLDQETSLMTQIAQLRVDAIRRDFAVQVKDTDPNVAGAAKDLRDNKIAAVYQQLGFDIENATKNAKDTVDESFGYLGQSLEDFGGVLWQSYFSMPRDRDAKIKELNEDLNVRIQQVNEDMTLSVRQREKKILRIEQENARKRAKVERELVEDKKQALKDWVASFSVGVGKILLEHAKVAAARRIKSGIESHIPSVGNFLFGKENQQEQSMAAVTTLLSQIQGGQQGNAGQQSASVSALLAQIGGTQTPAAGGGDAGGAAMGASILPQLVNVGGTSVPAVAPTVPAAFATAPSAGAGAAGLAGTLGTLGLVGTGVGVGLGVAALAYLFRDDLANFFDEVGFDDRLHDAELRRHAVKGGQKVAFGKTAKALGKSTRKDMIDHTVDGVQEGLMSRVGGSSSKQMREKDAQIAKLEGMVKTLTEQPIVINDSVNYVVDDRVIRGMEDRKRVLQRQNIIPKE